jgi:integrase
VGALTQRKVAMRLRQCFRYAEKFGMLRSNPATKIPLPAAADTETRPFDAAQARHFLATAAADRLQALYHVALDSGARQGELFALEWTDLDWARGELAICKSLEDSQGERSVKAPKTASGRRRVLLCPSTLAVLREHHARMRAEGHDSKLMFPATNGRHLRRGNVHWTSFKPLLRKAGLADFRFHDLRHTCASLLLLAGVNPKVVSERLGHASVEITLDIYSHLLPTIQEAAIAKLEAVLNPPPAENGSTLAAGQPADGAEAQAAASEGEVAPKVTGGMLQLTA